MVFDRYWPARHPGARDYAQGRSLRVRRLYWLVPLLGVLAPVVLALTRPNARMAGAIAGGVTLLIAAGVFLWAMAAPAPPGGVYEIDERGEPVEYIGKKVPLELRNVRPVTHEAFVQSVQSRRVTPPPN